MRRTKPIRISSKYEIIELFVGPHRFVAMVEELMGLRS